MKKTKFYPGLTSEMKKMGQLRMLMEELEVYEEDDSNVNFLATGGYDGDDGIEIVQFTKDSPYILRIETYARYLGLEEGKTRPERYDRYKLYFTFENEELLVDFLEENYR